MFAQPLTFLAFLITITDYAGRLSECINVSIVTEGAEMVSTIAPVSTFYDLVSDPVRLFARARDNVNSYYKLVCERRKISLTD